MRAFHHRQHTRAVPLLIGIPTVIWLGLSAAAAQTPDQVRTNSEPSALPAFPLSPTLAPPSLSWDETLKNLLDTLRYLMGWPAYAAATLDAPEAWMSDFVASYERYGTPPLNLLQRLTVTATVDSALAQLDIAPNTVDGEVVADLKSTLWRIREDVSRTPQD